MKTYKIKKYILITVALSVIITTFMYNILYREGIQFIGIDYDISDSDKIGFNVDTDALHFGTLLPGTSSERILELKSDYDAILKFEVMDIEHVFTDTDYLLLNKSQTNRLRVFAIIQKNTTPGHHEGKLKIISQRI